MPQSGPLMSPVGLPPSWAAATTAPAPACCSDQVLPLGPWGRSAQVHSSREGMVCNQEGAGGSAQVGGPAHPTVLSCLLSGVEPSCPQCPLRKPLLAFSRPCHIILSTPRLGVVTMRHLGHTPKSESTLSFVPEASHVPPPVPSAALACTPDTTARIRYPPPNPGSGRAKTTQQSTLLLLLFQNEKCALFWNVSKDLMRGSCKNGWLGRSKVAE